MSGDPAAGPSVHGTCLVVGETGILITGESGSGKTSLALAVIERANAAGRFARLVADDRVVLELRHGRVLARPAPSLAGFVEIRGLGIRPSAFEPACVIGLLVRRDETASRLPDAAELSADCLGLALPRLRVGGSDDPAKLVLAGLEAVESAFCDTPVTIS